MVGGGDWVDEGVGWAVGSDGDGEGEGEEGEERSEGSLSSSSSSSSSEASAAESMKVCLAGADLRRGGLAVLVFVLVAFDVGRGGLNAGRPRFAAGLEVGGIMVKVLMIEPGVVFEK